MFEQISQSLVNAFSHVLGAYLNKLVPMVGPGDVPLMIPDVLHEMIPVRAAIVAKVAENRDVAGLAALDARLYAQAMKELSDPTSSGGHSF